jgi:3-hydroxypropanoate dehydrogenase
MMARPIGEEAIGQLFVGARTHNRWTDRPVDPALLERAYTLAALGPTSMNCQPARFVFLSAPEAKTRLLPALAPMNVEKTRAAPFTAIIATDRRFYDQLPRTFPHLPAAREMYASNAEFAQVTAFRNGSLTGAYFILALRALGLDCGPMSGFSEEKVNAGSSRTASGGPTISSTPATAMAASSSRASQGCPPPKPAYFCKYWRQ